MGHYAPVIVGVMGLIATYVFVAAWGRHKKVKLLRAEMIGPKSELREKSDLLKALTQTTDRLQASLDFLYDCAGMADQALVMHPDPDELSRFLGKVDIALVVAPRLLSDNQKLAETFPLIVADMDRRLAKFEEVNSIAELRISSINDPRNAVAQFEADFKSLEVDLQDLMASERALSERFGGENVATLSFIVADCESTRSVTRAALDTLSRLAKKAKPGDVAEPALITAIEGVQDGLFHLRKEMTPFEKLGETSQKIFDVVDGLHCKVVAAIKIANSDAAIYPGLPAAGLVTEMTGSAISRLDLLLNPAEHGDPNSIIRELNLLLQSVEIAHSQLLAQR